MSLTTRELARTMRMKVTKARNLLSEWDAVISAGKDSWRLAPWAEPCGRAIAGFELEMAGQRCACGCGDEIIQAENDGRPRIYFKNACRQRAYRERIRERLS